MKNNKIICASYTKNTIRIYQAYNDSIANQAIKLGTFGSSFKMDRMTWIKPSFLWMMYRSGWATKESQERVLAIDIKRTGFDIILENAVLSSYREEVYGDYETWKSKLNDSQVRCQWDPDRDIYANPLDRRAIQLGLKGYFVKKYVDDWILKIADITSEVKEVKSKIESKDFDKIKLPIEEEYTLDPKIKATLGI